MRIYSFIFILFFPLYIKSSYLDYIYINTDPSINSFGQTGLIQTPSADTMGEGSIYFTLNKNNIWKLGTLTVTPYDWLEASYFYYRPTDLYFGKLKGKFLDKGFNLKMVLKFKNSSIPNIAIGLDDFAGTGIFSREYIVSTTEIKNIKITAGYGWGKYATGKQLDNPINFISDNLSNRPLPKSGDGQGGLPTYNTWFKGPANYLAGIEINIPHAKGLKLKAEYDPFDYNIFSTYPDSNLAFASNPKRAKDSDVNIGFSFPVNENLIFNLSYVKGNLVNFSFSFGGRYDKDRKKKEKFQPIVEKKFVNTKKDFYRSILKNVNKNNDIFLQTADLDETNKKLKLSVSTSKYINPIMLSSRTAYIAMQTKGFDIKNIQISQINTGIELNKITYKTSDILSKKTTLPMIIRNTDIEKGSMEYLDHEFQPKVKFPAIFSSFSPAIRTHVGSPEQFIYYGLGVKNNLEIQFARNLILKSEVGYNISDNFNEKVSRPDSPYLPNVRTEIVRYLQESNTYIDSLQLDYFFSPKQNLYSKISAGIFEPMYAGIGGEILYKPFNKNYSIGMELYKAKKRDYDQKFKLLDYEVYTGHLIFNYYLPRLGILTNLTYGRYLAKDVGYTFDISRKNKYGFRAGIFFSNTNVSEIEYGEGSFDKGFYFQIPFDFFSKSYSTNHLNFKLRPLTRDGAAKLEVGNDLGGIIFNSSHSEIYNGWHGFLK